MGPESPLQTPLRGIQPITMHNHALTTLTSAGTTGPDGCATILWAVGGGGDPPPPCLTPTLGVGGSGGQAEDSPGGGSVGTPTYLSQNDPHDTLIILNMHKWGKNIFKRKIAHQLRLPSAKVQPGGRVGVKILFCAFQPFLNSPQTSEYFGVQTHMVEQKFPPTVCLKQNLRRLWRPQNPLICTTIFGSVEGGGVPPPLGSGLDQDRPPWRAAAGRQAPVSRARAVGGRPPAGGA